MKILLAIDGSSCSNVAVSAIVTRPWPPASEVKIISAVNPAIYIAPEPWIGDQNYSDEVVRVEYEQAEAAVREAKSEFDKSDNTTLKVTTDVIQGSARQVIVEEAEKWGADLIVLGSHGYSTWNRLLLGSVSRAVAIHAPCSVEIARCRPVGASKS